MYTVYIYITYISYSPLTSTSGIVKQYIWWGCQCPNPWKMPFKIRILCSICV